MQGSYDVVILGGGPAGSGTALALRRHDPTLSVAVVESSDYSRLRIGESLPPPTRKLLEHLGVWEAFQEEGHDPSYGTAAAWGSEEVYDNEFLFRTYSQGWHLDRARFDALMARRAEEEGARVCRRSVFLDAEPAHGPGGDPGSDQSGWHLRLRHRKGGEIRPVKARFVIDATGRKGTFARRRKVGRRVHDDLLGLYGFFQQSPDQQPIVTSTLVEAWEEGWWYSARLPGDRLVIACMSDADRVAELGLREPDAWRLALEATRHTRTLLDGAAMEEGPICYPAQSQLLDEASGDGWLAVGDAAAAYDPLSSQGIFKALHFGIWAAYATADHLCGDPGALRKYAHLVERDFQGYLDTRRSYYRQETRWPTAPFWRRRHGPRLVAPHSSESLPVQSSHHGQL